MIDLIIIFGQVVIYAIPPPPILISSSTRQFYHVLEHEGDYSLLCVCVCVHFFLFTLIICNFLWRFMLQQS